MTSVHDALSRLTPAGPIRNQWTMPMEQLDHYYGFVLYRTQIPDKFAISKAEISIPGVRDRAIVFVGKVSRCLRLRISDNWPATAQGMQLA